MQRTHTPPSDAGVEPVAREPILRVKGLKTHFFSREGVLKAVDGLDFEVAPGETLGIAGESGCGKTVTSLSILRILPPGAKIVAGEILLSASGGEIDLARLHPRGRRIRDIRGKDISMVFQEPMTSFSPVHTIGNQVMEVVRLHQAVTRTEAERRALDMLELVGMPRPDQAMHAYPFTLSGGMRQRAMMAMALACRPRVLIADEPTTAVDVTIQAQLLQLIQRLQRELGMALIIITHDLAVIAELADRILIMYLGKAVEYGPVREVLRDPKHPYTRGLLKSIPKLERGRRKLEPIAGTVPSLYEIPEGCSFHPRCPHSMPACAEREPGIVNVGQGRGARCFLYEE